MTSDMVTAEENSPEQDVMYVINGNPKTLEISQSDVYFGESIISFRSLLKRYCFHRALQLDVSAASGTKSVYLFNYDFYNVPVGPGLSYGSSRADGLTGISPATPYNICTLTYLRFIMSAYIGYRGGLRWKVSGLAQANSKMSLRAARLGLSSTEGETVSLVLSPTVSQSTTAQRFIGATTYHRNHCGVAATVGSTVPTLEYEIPFYHRYRYAECNGPPATGPNVVTDRTHSVSITHQATTNADIGWIETHCAIGEDFSLFFFIGAPPLLISDVESVTPA
jgi:hypothetical protein